MRIKYQNMTDIMSGDRQPENWFVVRNASLSKN